MELALGSIEGVMLSSAGVFRVGSKDEGHYSRTSGTMSQKCEYVRRGVDVVKSENPWKVWADFVKHREQCIRRY